jgi:hypothetical protein
MGMYQQHDRRSEPGILQHQWLPETSPASYVPGPYGVEHVHSQMAGSGQEFRMTEMGMMHPELADVHISNGMPMMNVISMDDFAPHSRTLPVRAMSTPQSLMLEHSSQDGSRMGLLHSAFYSS